MILASSIIIIICSLTHSLVHCSINKHTLKYTTRLCTNSNKHTQTGQIRSEADRQRHTQYSEIYTHRQTVMQTCSEQASTHTHTHTHTESHIHTHLSHTHTLKSYSHTRFKSFKTHTHIPAHKNTCTHTLTCNAHSPKHTHRKGEGVHPRTPKPKIKCHTSCTYIDRCTRRQCNKGRRSYTCRLFHTSTNSICLKCWYV